MRMDAIKPKLCMVAHNAYGAMTGGKAGFIGGVERQVSLMAKWLVDKGWGVSVITWNEGGPAEEIIDGVQVIKACRHDEGIPLVRFVWPRWTSLNAAMRRADADVYYQNCGEYVTGQVALWCRRHKRRFIYSVADDPDCDRRLPLMKTARERVLYRYGLCRADRVIAQTRKQQQALHSGFGVESTVVPMPCSTRVQPTCVASPSAPNGRLLWVGRICEKKRPDRLIDLARLCPDLSFDLVGPADRSGYGERIVQQTKRLSNIVVRGPVPRSSMEAVYRSGTCLICTSDYEGFPNTFLEAWRCGLPIITTFDPDDLVADRELGIVS